MDRSRPDALGRLAELVIPAKIGLTKRFFAAPGLPPHLQKLRRRALSAAYLRAIDYLQMSRPRHWLPAARLLAQATVADPLNVGSISERATRPFRRRLRRLLAPVFGAMRLVARMCRWLLRLVAALLTVPLPWVGRQLERVFLRGNRELTLKIDGLQRRVAAAEQAASAAIDPLVGPVQRLGADVSRLTGALESLNHQHAALRKDLEESRAQLPALPSALREVYGTPPALRRIPGWHTYWGVENRSDRFLQSRAELWSSLKSPVVMRWFADLLVMIWPGNELSRVLFLTGNFEPNELTWVTQVLTEGKTMIDIGAHMGMYSMIASKLVGDSGIVIAMEPSTREFQRLAFHVTLNDLRTSVASKRQPATLPRKQR